MSVTLRAWRGGRKKRPYYRIVAIDKRRARDSRYLDNLGHYHPLSTTEKTHSLDLERVRSWLRKGASTSNLVRQLLKKEGVLREFERPARKTKRRRSRMNPIAERVTMKKAHVLKQKEGERKRQEALARKQKEADEAAESKVESAEPSQAPSEAPEPKDESSESSKQTEGSPSH